MGVRLSVCGKGGQCQKTAVDLRRGGRRQESVELGRRHTAPHTHGVSEQEGNVLKGNMKPQRACMMGDVCRSRVGCVWRVF